MKPLLYIIFLVLVITLVPSTIGVNSIANGQTLGINEERIVDIYIKNSPPSFQLYHYIKKYAGIYEVPLPVAYKVAKLETNFKGPLFFNYDPAQTSSADAYGPLQIILSTGKFISGNPNLTKEDLLYNIELNAMLSMMYMRYLYDIYHDWALAAGYYNSGRPQLNDYAMAVKEVTNYGK